MKLHLSPCLALKHELPHSAIENPEITEEAERFEGGLEKILDLPENVDIYRKKLFFEALLLSKWKEKEERDWREYFDSPLISHADASLQLKGKYDAVVAIRDAGIPYSKIFEIIGFPVFEIDYSHHKRKMNKPIISDSQLEELKHKKSVLLVDIDFVTGKTLRKVTEYLRENEVNVKGAYIGLFKWPGIDSGKKYHVGTDTVNFDSFWHLSPITGLSKVREDIMLKNGKPVFPYRKYKKLLPSDFELYTSNPYILNSNETAKNVVDRVGKYIVVKEIKEKMFDKR